MYMSVISCNRPYNRGSVKIVLKSDKKSMIKTTKPKVNKVKTYPQGQYTGRTSTSPNETKKYMDFSVTIIFSKFSIKTQK
jgi:hypothetical protein